MYRLLASLRRWAWITAAPCLAAAHPLRVRLAAAALAPRVHPLARVVLRGLARPHRPARRRERRRRAFRAFESP